ncbi:MAG: hypothetical protein IRY97_11830 [Thermomicrobiaceae bacterium]|nr:hypothetical protein [Thermomicrobiaceae bacterium]
MASAWLFERGEWSKIDDPLEERTIEALTRHGYSPAPAAIFGTSGDEPGLTIEVYGVRDPDQPPRHPFVVLMPALTAEPIFAADLPSLVQLLGQLIPLAEATTT